MQMARQSIRKGQFQREFRSLFSLWSVKTMTQVSETKLWEFLCHWQLPALRRKMSPPGTYELSPSAKKVYHLGPKVSASFVSQSNVQHLYHPHSPGREPAAHRGTPHAHTNTETPPNVYPLLLSMIWNEPHKGGDDTTLNSDGRLGRESSAAYGHRTKITWIRFDPNAIRCFLSSLVHNW
jgi:hypothetical protein